MGNVVTDEAVSHSPLARQDEHRASLRNVSLCRLRGGAASVVAAVRGSAKSGLDRSGAGGGRNAVTLKRVSTREVANGEGAGRGGGAGRGRRRGAWAEARGAGAEARGGSAARGEGTPSRWTVPGAAVTAPPTTAAAATGTRARTASTQRAVRRACGRRRRGPRPGPRRGRSTAAARSSQASAVITAEPGARRSPARGRRCAGVDVDRAQPEARRHGRRHGNASPGRPDDDDEAAGTRSGRPEARAGRRQRRRPRECIIRGGATRPPGSETDVD